jgi:excisionase family DNA binding protein
VPDVVPVYDRVSMTLVDAAELAGVPRMFLRARAAWGELSVHWLSPDSHRGIVRLAELHPWMHARRGLGLTVDQEVSVAEGPIAYSFISCSVRDAATRSGVSEATLNKAIAQGYLIAHRAGDKGGKRIIRAEDLDAWVRSLPTERAGERWL